MPPGHVALLSTQALHRAVDICLASCCLPHPAGMREAIEAAASAEVNERKIWEAAKAMGDQNSTFTSQRILQLRAKVSSTFFLS